MSDACAPNLSQTNGLLKYCHREPILNKGALLEVYLYERKITRLYGMQSISKE